jgi:hypothetical protein
LKVNLCSVRKHVADAPVVPIYANPWFRSMQSGNSKGLQGRRHRKIEFL